MKMRSLVFLMLALIGASSVFGQQQHPKVVNTVADLARQNPNDVHRTVKVLGYFSPNDGGGGLFVVTNTASGVNDGTRFASTASGKSWERVLEAGQPISVKMFGAKGDGTDASNSIQAAYDVAEDGQTVFLARGEYTVTSIAVTGTKTVRFLGEVGARLVHSSAATTSLFTTGSDTNVQTLIFEFLMLDGNKANRSANYGDIINNASLISVASSYKTLIVRDCIFTNSVRASIRVAGPASITDSQFLSMNQHDGSHDTYTIFAQPSFSTQLEDMRLEVRGCVLKAEDTSIDALWANPGGIFITESDTGSATEAVYDRVNIIGNWFYGIGCDRAVNELDPIRVYNGARRVAVTHNHIDGFPFIGIGIQRTDFADVSHNTITRGENTKNGASGGTNQCFGIAIAPKAREGIAPFTAGRANEQHWGFIVAHNVITNVHRSGITIFGGQGTIFNNWVENIQPDGAGIVLPIVITQGASDVDVLNNTIKNCAANDIFVSGSAGLVERVNVRGNRSIADDTVKTGVAVLFAEGVVDSAIENNTVIMDEGSAAIAYSVRGSTNIAVRGNWAYNGLIGFDTRTAPENIAFEDNVAAECETGFRTADTATELRFRRNQTVDCTTSFSLKDTSGPVIIEDHYHNGTTTPYSFDPGVSLTRRNNSDFPFATRRDTNAVFGTVVYNGSTNTEAGALADVQTADSGGGVRAYPSTYSNSRLADRVALATHSTASGIVFYAPFQDQDFRWILWPSETEYMRLTTNALRTAVVTVNPDPYDAGWATSTNAPTQKDVYDKIETLVSAVDPILINGVEVTDSAGVDFQTQPLDILITHAPGVSPDSAVFSFARFGSLASDPPMANNFATFGTRGVLFEGGTSDSNEGIIEGATFSADQTFILPDRSGTFSLSGDTFTGDMIATLESDGSTAVTAAETMTKDAEWDSASEINGATTDDDFVTLTGAQTISGTKTFSGPILQTPDAIAGTDIDWSTGNFFTVTTAGNITFTFSNPTAGQWITVKVTAGGAHTVTWPTVTWKDGSTPSQTASKVDFYTFIYDGTTFYGEASQNY